MSKLWSSLCRPPSTSDAPVSFLGPNSPPNPVSELIYPDGMSAPARDHSPDILCSPHSPQEKDPPCSCPVRPPDLSLSSPPAHLHLPRHTWHCLCLATRPQVSPPQTAPRGSPTAAVANCHKLRGLKQHTFITSWFCKSGVQVGSPWAESRSCLPSGGSGENPFPAPSSFQGHQHSLAYGPLLQL